MNLMKSYWYDLDTSVSDSLHNYTSFIPVRSTDVRCVNPYAEGKMEDDYLALNWVISDNTV